MWIGRIKQSGLAVSMNEDDEDTPDEDEDEDARGAALVQVSLIA
jgi:hypothetical protein